MFTACTRCAASLEADDWRGWVLLRDSGYEYLLIGKET
jgi:hypothetical protein